MRFDSFAEFLAMGGHGAFVWSAYAIALVVIVGNFVWPRLQAQKNLLQVRKQLGLSDQPEQDN